MSGVTLKRSTFGLNILGVLTLVYKIMFRTLRRRLFKFYDLQCLAVEECKPILLIPRKLYIFSTSVDCRDDEFFTHNGGTENQSN
jgi:hypothetical protein